MTYKYMRKADAVNYWRNQIKPRVLMLRSANDMAALRGLGTTTWTACVRTAA